MASKDNLEWAKDEVQGQKEFHYSKYLQLEKILEAQRTTSDVHDEHLFVVIHQVYEMWFKQLRHEIDSICKEFKSKDTNFLNVVTRLDRIIKILKLLVEQIRILETMSPQDFLEFRGNLFPASGFQSFQFRMMEYRIGFNEKSRTEFEGSLEGYKKVMSDKEKKDMADEQGKDTMFACIQEWLETLVGDFPEKYEKAVTKMLEAEKKSDKEKRWFATLTNKDEYETILQQKKKEKAADRRFTWMATFGALKIYLYRDKPQFQMPYQILNQLIEMDTLLMKWRYSHMYLVQYQIGNRGGTGGTSGVDYLQETVRNKPLFFPDLLNMTSFFIVKKYIPEL